MLKKHFFTIVYVSWMMFVTWSSLFSFKDQTLPRIEIPHLDKLVHFTFYFVAVILCVMAVREITRGNNQFSKTLIWAVLTMIFFGIIIEVFQYSFTSNRMGDMYDVLANSVGAFCGAWTMKMIFLKVKKLNWKQ